MGLYLCSYAFLSLAGSILSYWLSGAACFPYVSMFSLLFCFNYDLPLPEILFAYCRNCRRGSQSICRYISDGWISVTFADLASLKLFKTGSFIHNLSAGVHMIGYWALL